MFKRFFFLIALSSCLFCEEAYVVCLHGFMGGSWTLRFIEKNLKKEGWEVVNWNYPSREGFIADHGKTLAPFLKTLSEKHPGRPIHFVTHSMGGLVLLSALNHPLCPNEAKIGKVVFIAPPFKGSCWGRKAGQVPLARWIAKDYSGYELMTKPNFDDLGYPDTFENVLVIAGSLGFNPFLKGPNDGTLSVEETFLPIPHEHIVIRRGHKTVVFSKKVYRLISEFLKNK